MWCIFVNRVNMIVVGLTGGIGTGKTQVSAILETLGATVVNADVLGHEVYRRESEGWRAVVGQFGEGILADDGEVDRKKLAAIVFSDSRQLEKLNEITHPRIYRLAEARIADLVQRGVQAVVLEAALLIEAGWTPLVDEVWVTTTPECMVIERLRSRSGMSAEQVRSRMQAQMAQSERVGHADVVIENSGDLAELASKVEQLWKCRVLAHKESGRIR
jgi:dephospho-CoA kinase